MKNEATFNIAVGLILARLLEAFPADTRLDLTKLEPGVSADDVELFDGTMEFLITEGFVRARRLGDGLPYYTGAKLTLRALDLLNTVPAALEKKAPLGERITSAVKSGAKETIAAAAREFLRYAASQASGLLPP